jgi:tRNA A37 methylthiotransferase MiaB
VGLLLEADRAMRKDYLEGQPGKTLYVIAESESGRGKDRMLKGTSENYIEVRFRAENAEVGEICPVRILSVRGRGLEGRIRVADARS